MLAFASCASAGTLFFPPLSPSFFGNLVQAEAQCGPTSAVNSFVYLQKAFPLTYGTSLVPSVDPLNPTQTEMQTIESKLATLMLTDATGTSWPNFIIGKQKYINGAASGTTVITGESSELWPVQDGSKPPNVSDLTPPTAQFIFDQLRAGRDLEILAASQSGGIGHWVTVTGINYDTTQETGTIYYIDPDTGLPGQARLDGTNSGGLAVNLDFQLIAAVSEGPIPEPATGVLLAGGALLLYWRRRRV